MVGACRDLIGAGPPSGPVRSTVRCRGGSASSLIARTNIPGAQHKSGRICLDTAGRFATCCAHPGHGHRPGWRRFSQVSPGGAAQGETSITHIIQGPTP